MKKLLKKIVLIVLSLFLTGSIFAIPVFAAGNVCSQISGNSVKETVFMVNTGSRWVASDYIKLTQTKGTMKTYNVRVSGDFYSTRSMYEIYNIKVEKIVNSKVTNTKNTKMDGGSLKIKLDKNSNYRVTVTPTYVKEKRMKNNAFNMGPAFNPYPGGGLLWAPRGWTKVSTWKVTTTKGILSCS